MIKIEEIDDMIEFGGSHYILDLDKFNKLIMLTPKKDEKHIETTTKTTYKPNHSNPTEVHIDRTIVTSREYDKQPEINTPTYDAVRMCLEILLTYNEELDDTLGTERAFKGTTIPFKIAFNTLRSYGILKEIEIDEE